MTSASKAVLSNRQIARAAGIVVIGFMASGVLGLVRTVLFSVTLGGSAELDAFYAAQRIPEMIYVLVAGGALSSSFIPVFARYWANADTEGAWRLASAVLTLATLIAAVLALILALAAPWVVPNLLVPGAPAPIADLTTRLTQIMMTTVVIFTASGLIMGILNARQQFVLPSLALSMNNLGQIFGALVLIRFIPQYGLNYGTAFAAPNVNAVMTGLLPNDGGAEVMALAFGALLGAALHLIVQLPGLPRVGARLRYLADWRVEGARDVLVLMLPRVLGLAVVQFNFLVNIVLTSAMLPGSRTALVTAWTLMFFVLGVIGQSIGTAVFPSLSALAAAGDMTGFQDRLAVAMRGMLFLAFPASVGMIMLGAVGIELVFEHGAWTAEQTRATAWALAFFAVGIPGHSLLELLARSFYALSDTWTPVLVGVGSMAANILLSLLLIRVIGDQNSLSSGPFAGLALANSLTTLVEASLLWALLRRRIGTLHDGRVLRGAGLSLLAALGMAAAIFVVEHLVTDLPPLWGVIFGLLAGVGAYFLLAFLLRLDEARTVPNAVFRRMRR